MDGSEPLPKNQHEKFAQFCAGGKSDSQAYKAAGYKGIPIKCATEIRSFPGVSARIAWLKRQSASESTLSSIEKREKLAKLVREDSAEVRDMIKAIEVDNVMAGHNKPAEVAVTGDLTLSVEQLMAAVSHGKSHT